VNLVRALKAFIKVLFGGGECEHPRVNLMEAPTYCSDCGYRIRIEWLFVHCRGCQARRVPHKTLFGEIRPVQQYCRHCGDGHFKIVKKEFIDAFELMYALSIKAVVYGDDTAPERRATPRNPFKTTVTMESGDVFEAEVIRKSEYKGTKSAFKGSPFDWQTQQDPKRYGGANIVPLRRSS
jgi:hypothetical protein